MLLLYLSQVSLFADLDTPINEYKATLILGIVEFAGAVICVILVHWTGKRMLLITTTAGCAVCLFILATYDYFRLELKNSPITSLTWIPLVFLNLNAFLLHAGIRLLPWVLIGEVRITVPSMVYGSSLINYK